MYAYTYDHIIEKYLAPFVNSKFNNTCYLIQDNDPKHTSKVCNDALERNNIVWV